MTGHSWWQSGIVYQIYPRSFMDSDGDGVGDLRGIVQRLDYVQELGVDAVWLSPIFPSPMKDFGYDVADYVGVDPIFGTLDDADRLIAEIHRRGLKLILDFVPNHTSDQHAWFKESRSSRDNPKRDWYIWRDARPDGSPPNNWRSVFGGGAWEWDEPTGQYYYHAFLDSQPDLNWRNPEVRQAMYDVLRFWLDRGVDGFRVDVMWHLVKDEAFTDNPVNQGFRAGQSPYDEFTPLYTTDRPEVQDIVAEMRHVLDAYADRVLIGEIYLPVERLVAYYGADLRGAHLPFNFQLIDAPWNAAGIATMIREYESHLPAGGWPNWVLGNHDKSRIASRLGRRQARVAGMMLLTLRGTPTMYYGDEIGMADAVIPPDRVQDPFEKNVPGLGLGRDPGRTPMRWDGSAGGGFTGGRPWLPMGDDVATVNVAAERHDPRSLLTFYRRLIRLRHDEPALSVGSWSLATTAGTALAYVRQDGGRRLLVALNLGPSDTTLDLPDASGDAKVLLSTGLDRDGEAVGRQLQLRGDEGLVVELGGT